jgi:hypothetical protein
MTDEATDKLPPKDKAEEKDAAAPLLTDEEFAYLDRDGDGVVHMHEWTVMAQYGDTSPAKARKAAPENKDRRKDAEDAEESTPATDRRDPKPTQYPAASDRRGKR